MPVLNPRRLAALLLAATSLGFMVPAFAQTAELGIPLAITSHAPLDMVPADSSFTVRGSTAPLASVDAEVLALVAGANMAEVLYDQRFTADADGSFSFEVIPQTPVPGGRYEISLTANASNQTKALRLVLHARP